MILPIAVAAWSLLSDRPLEFVKPFLRNGHHFVVCAHRGDHTEAPENTLDAYETAVQDDADFGETDLRMTKDGVIVLMHDDKVDRTTDGHGRVTSFTFADIRALKIKGARRPDEKVPTFDELLADVKGKLSIYMDIKAVHAKDVLPLLKKYGMEKDVIAYVYTPWQVDEWRRDAPEIPIITDFQMKSGDQIESTWRAHPFAITDGGYEDYTGEFINTWHRLNVAVVPDIQGQDESPAKWKPMIDMGVDGLQTDHPKALVEYLKSLGLR